MNIDEEETAWDLVRDRINFDVESGEIKFNKKHDRRPSALEQDEDEDEPAETETTELLDLDNQQPGPSTAKIARKANRKKSAITTAVNSLIGQGNLEHARGRTREAMAYLFEAIKMAPYHVQTYKELSDIYRELNQMEKSFEFKMLAALLADNKTTAEEWDDIADMAESFNRLELAIACLAKAIRRDPGNWVYYDKRIQILDATGDNELAMKTRLQAAQSINCQNSDVTFAWIEKTIKSTADYYCTLKDEERATLALEAFVTRSREFGRPIQSEHLALLEMWMAKGRYEDVSQSILALQQESIKAVMEDGNEAFEIIFTSTSAYTITPWPPPAGLNWLIADQIQPMFLTHLIISFVHLRQFHLINGLVEKLLEKAPVGGPEEEAAILEIARALHAQQQIGLAVDYISRLKDKRPEFAENSEALFLSGYFYQLLDQIDVAREAYERVITIQPDHIDARINLSTILQQMGYSELALETLKDLTLDSNCSQIPDERLLVRQAQVLLEQHGQSKRQQYINCLRMLLIPHFYTVHLMADEITKAGRKKTDKVLHVALKRCAIEAIRGSPLEKMVKRLGTIAHLNQRPTDELNPNELHDFMLKLAEALYMAGVYEEMLVVVCYAFLHPQIIAQSSQIFNNLLFFAAIKARNFALAFEFLRFQMTYTLPRTIKGPDIVGDDGAINIASSSKTREQALEQSMKAVYIAMNYILCQHQSVNYHRFIMRQLVIKPDSDALHIISGNNSLVTGAYRHALGEYFSVWLRHRQNPLLAFLIALTFGHISCKKDISSRHVVAIRALAFMDKYAHFRAPTLCQEVQYNMGRLFHQMGILANAIKCYERVLYECPTPMVWVEDPDGLMAPRPEPAEKYDLRRLAAYNLSLIYDSTGNRLVARHILEEFCTI